eukprot:CAMPEP_0185904746 /NCGR_PEP_ID=MMETSP0196C-20130402/4029_1 /TAXON_ID=2932 /ORGANISM="Alexandrium fundyense, Strain CCMP1719" /LENGTH=82 /DNA_ID=CAMNT_0028624119 /DNA_START=27 /DNA_END=271 /DNA_ORIENTATION=+
MAGSSLSLELQPSSDVFGAASDESSEPVSSSSLLSEGLPVKQICMTVSSIDSSATMAFRSLLCPAMAKSASPSPCLWLLERA